MTHYSAVNFSFLQKNNANHSNVLLTRQTLTHRCTSIQQLKSYHHAVVHEDYLGATPLIASITKTIIIIIDICIANQKNWSHCYYYILIIIYLLHLQVWPVCARKVCKWRNNLDWVTRPASCYSSNTTNNSTVTRYNKHSDSGAGYRQ